MDGHSGLSFGVSKLLALLFMLCPVPLGLEAWKPPFLHSLAGEFSFRIFQREAFVERLEGWRERKAVKYSFPPEVAIHGDTDVEKVLVVSATAAVNPLHWCGRSLRSSDILKASSGPP